MFLVTRITFFTFVSNLMNKNTFLRDIRIWCTLIITYKSRGRARLEENSSISHKMIRRKIFPDPTQKNFRRISYCNFTLFCMRMAYTLTFKLLSLTLWNYRFRCYNNTWIGSFLHVTFSYFLSNKAVYNYTNPIIYLIFKSYHYSFI